MDRVELAFLWHMHQPPYREPATGAYLLPWVRLHATRGYLDMAWIHERFPQVRGTVNFSPILLEQLEDYAAGRARDRLMDLTVCPAAELSEADRILLLRTFFMVSWEQGVRPLQRYRELLHKRGLDLSYVDLVEVARTFTERDLRDLQLLFNLAWMGFAARARDATVQELLQKGRDYSEADKAALLEAQRSLVASVIPAWKSLFSAGAVELSLTPYYHPILPLLCDTDAARVAMPQTPLPPRLLARDDAEEQVRLALEKGREVFGRAPEGMWPAEGSVSPEALAVFAGQQVKWVASDEEVLVRSLPPGTDRRGAVYRPWRVRAGGEGEIAMVFRDRGISDALGFVYARSPPAEAVSDFLGRLNRIADEIPADQRREGELPLVSVILDGENPWEHYPNSGLDFLTELFSRLEKQEAGVVTTTIGGRIRRGLPPGRVEKIHAGSWIEASFRIWIGHPEEVQAWSLVGMAKEALREAEREGVPREMIEKARRHLLTAQASDWFWWYGEDFVTETKSDFDRLFRERIQAVFRTLGQPVPSVALEPIGDAGAGPAGGETGRAPVGFIHPRLDGEITSWQEWLGAGLLRAEEVRGGSMHQATGDIGTIRYGFDSKTFYLRIDLGSDDSTQRPTQIEELRIDLRVGDREVELQTKLTRGALLIYTADQKVELGAGVFGSIVEIALPFSDLELRAGQRVRFLLRGMRGAVEVERLPSTGWLAFDVPDESFEQRTWKV